MALAYETDTITTLNTLWDRLDDWLVNDAGWTKAETVNTRDAIYKSEGVDGKVNMVFRISTSATAGNPFLNKAPYNVHNQFPWILVQGYNTWTVGAPGSGTGYYGQWGPWVMSDIINTGNILADTYRVFRFNGTFPLSTASDVAMLGRTRRTKTADSYENTSAMWDGRRKFIGGNTVSTAQLSWSDLAHGEALASSGGIPPQANAYTTRPVLVHDLVNDKDLVFTLNTTATLASQWLKYDIETNTWSTMAAPTWTASSITGSCLVWDGNNTIYALHGNGTTEFAKYSISGNSWTNLTASPVARTASFAINSTASPSQMIYVPNSVTGIGQDVIYCALANSGTVFYRYRVTDNAWDSTSGAGALTAQQTIGNSTFLIWDGIKYCYHATANVAPNQWYRSDLSVAPNTWTSMGNVQSAIRLLGNPQIINHIPCKVRAHASANITYWFLGDEDSATVVVKIGTATPHYYWMYFGRFSSSNRPDVMTLTDATTAGVHANFEVDDTSKYDANDVVVIWDPSNGTSEATTIYEIVDGTNFTATVSNNYTTGTRVGIDPTPWIAAGNGMGICPTDSAGTMSDNEVAGYIIEPTADANATRRSSPGVRGLYQPVPISIFNDESTSHKYENRGFLKNTYSLSTGTYPVAQAEASIVIAGKTYKFFTDTETSRYTIDTRGVLIGPID